MAENSRKSFRKSVRNVTKKLFSKNKDKKNKDENFEKQKKENSDLCKWSAWQRSNPILIKFAWTNELRKLVTYLSQ